jgi:hypothetical protein
MPYPWSAKSFRSDESVSPDCRKHRRSAAGPMADRAFRIKAGVLPVPRRVHHDHVQLLSRLPARSSDEDARIVRVKTECSRSRSASRLAIASRTASAFSSTPITSFALAFLASDETDRAHAAVGVQNRLPAGETASVRNGLMRRGFSVCSGFT